MITNEDLSVSHSFCLLHASGRSVELSGHLSDLTLRREGWGTVKRSSGLKGLHALQSGRRLRVLLNSKPDVD